MGKFVGRDQFGNKYYSSSAKKRWVIYNNNIDSSKIPPEWHLWIHSQTASPPSEKIKRFSWQKKYEENLTGTKKAYKPEGSLTSDFKKNTKKYENWKS